MPSPLRQGIGRCVNANCRSLQEESPPPSGYSSNPIEAEETWCDSLVNWDGRVIRMPQGDLPCIPPPAEASTCTDVGKAWGVCSINNPMLPSLGFDYDAEALIRSLSMPIAQLFSEHPGCGDTPVMFVRNRAVRNGGGLFKDSCDQGLEAKGLCWVGDISDKTSSSFVLSFEENSAGGSGGAIHTGCLNLGACQEVFKKAIGLPSPSGEPVKLFTFLSNIAEGFGNDVSSAPNRLTITQHATVYVPGKDSLDVTFSLLDSQGQLVAGSDETPISHMIQVLVLPHASDCSSFSSCELMKLQPPEPYLSSGAHITTSLLDDFDTAIPLKFCQVDVKVVDIRLFVMKSALMDAPADDIPTLQKTLTVTCLPCEPGWTRVTEGGLWTCKKCESSNYIIDPNLHKCQPCPEGATCDGNQLTPKIKGSVWDEGVSTGVYRLSRCPPGYVLIRDEAFSVLDRCVACPPDTYSVDEALFGQRLWTRSVENYLNNTCKLCPRRAAMCAGADNLRPLPGTPLHSQCAECVCAMCIHETYLACVCALVCVCVHSYTSGWWSPLGFANRSNDGRRTEFNHSSATGREIKIYRCSPPTVCLGANETYRNGRCMPGAYGPLCGICDEKNGYATSRDGCRKCNTVDTSTGFACACVMSGCVCVYV